MKYRCHALAALALAAAALPAHAQLKAEVIHWWTSGGESAAAKTLADAYKAQGGLWVDTAVALGEQARSVAINRIAGGNPPTAAQFNTTQQFRDIVDQGLLNNVDEVAKRDGWDKFLPETVLQAIRVNGHYYAAPVNIHNMTWFWFSKAAFKKAGIAEEPKTFDELFAALDKLKAAGLVPLAHGGQPWQDGIVFTATLAHFGGRDLYLKVFRDRDPKAILGEDFKKVLLAYKKLQSYTDKGSPGRNWNDATAMLINGRAGVQIMGDWAKGEFAQAKQEAGKDYGCAPGFGPKAPYIIQGDVMVFPKTAKPDQVKAQQLLASVITQPATQVAFSIKKGSIPIRTDVDVSKMDVCAQMGVAAMKDKSRHLANGEIFITPDQNGALQDVLTSYWNRNVPVEKVQKDIVSALRN